MAQYRITYARPGWQKLVGIVVIGALVAAAVVLLLGLAILLVPVVAVAVLIARWRLAKLSAETRNAADDHQKRGDQAAGIIDGEFRVIGRDHSRS